MATDTKPLSKMSDDELNDLRIKLSTDKGTLKAMKRAVAAEFNKRQAKQSATAKVRKMSVAERDAMAEALQVIGAESVASKEQVGTPGAAPPSTE